MSKEKKLLDKKIENLIFIKQHDAAISTKVNGERWIDLIQYIDVVELHRFINEESCDTVTIKIGEDKNLNTIFSRLILLVQNQIKDNEINPLYIGFDYVCFKDKEKSNIVKAPMYFLPVRIRFVKKQLVIEKYQTQKIVNDKLFFFLKQLKLASDPNTFISDLKKHPHVPAALETIECDYQPKRCDGFILGVFELCDTFFYDVTKNVVAKNKTPFKNKAKLTKEKISEMELSNKEIVQITPNPLNIYQRRALISALNQNTIIYGPPGTGKSETITNFIATILNRNQTAIIASEKNAALQVLKERLGALNDFCFFADSTLTKKDFYGRIQKLGELINFSERARWNIKKPTAFENDNSKKQVREAITANINYYQSAKQTDLDLSKYFEQVKAFEKHAFLKNSLELLKDKAQLKILDLIKLINQLEINSDFNFKQLITMVDEIKADLKLVDLNLKDKVAFGTALKHAEEIDNLLNEEQITYVNAHWNTIYDELNAIKFLSQEFSPYCDDFKNIIQNETIMNNLVKGLDHANKKEDKFIINFLKINGFDLKAMEISGAFGLNKKGQIVKLGLIAAATNPLVKAKNSNKIFDNVALFKPFNTFLLKYPNFQDQSIQACLDVNINNYIEDKAILDYLLEHKITKEDVQTLINLINFEKIVILKAKANNLPNNENSLYEKYYNALKQSQTSIIDIMKAKLIENLQFKLFKLKNSEIHTQIEKIFQLSNLDKKLDIDKFINTYKDGLLELFDVWLGRPEQLTHYIYPSKKTFDYAIFDEASQMYMERSLAILNKCDIKVIAGDDKQLKPANWFETRYVGSEFDLDADVAESLLERAKVAMWPEFILKYHYRSRSYELIKFSNDEFYNQQLEYASWNNENHQVIEIYDVNGYVDDGKNDVEAQKVLDILSEKHKLYKKIIVVTFGLKQAEHITNMLLKSTFVDLKERMLANTLVIINLENVQGNEADLIIISNTYGKNKTKKMMTNHFGSLIQSGGKNRLNVALTRAKEKMIIIKSFKANEMAWNRDNENAVSYFHWIKFLDEYKVQKRVPVTIKSDKWNNLENFLRQRLDQNLKIETGYVVGSKTFDFFITNPKNDRNLGIEVVGLDYFSSELNMIEDFETHLFIKNRNYQCLFISEFDWHTNPIRIINEIKTFIDKGSILKLTTKQK